MDKLKDSVSRLVSLPSIVRDEFGGVRKYFRHQGSVRHGLSWLFWHVAVPFTADPVV
jgi:hypothetical protein